MNSSKKNSFILSTCLLPIFLAACHSNIASFVAAKNSGNSTPPGARFDLTHWNITLPTDDDEDDKPDTISVRNLQTFSNSDFFYLDDDSRMVFVSPNKAATTPNSSNARSELRYMSRGHNEQIRTKSPQNNFALASHPQADEFASIGGKMEATLQVDHVSKRAGNPENPSSYSVVIGQIHATKFDQQLNGFGWGNEPLKIYFKKHPTHEMGSVFWNYERNLARNHPERRDISYVVWGQDWTSSQDPGVSGLALGEPFSYTVNVFEDTMHLTFDTVRHAPVKFTINLTDNIDANGLADLSDHPEGYAGDVHYFKAGAYNQCSTRVSEDKRSPACSGTGDWSIDHSNGDYVMVRFHRLVVGASEAP